ncbi:MAG: hypothetical protein R3335_10680 [Anaerolineales bacterium]|nr:hypothetical protein [Anaerolineales bacterium]
MQHKTHPTHEHHEHEWFVPGHGPGKIAGGMMILIGAIALLAMSGTKILGYSPWVLMALVPVLWISLAAVQSYREDGRISRRVIALAAVSLTPFVFAGAALLGFNMAALWPVGVIGIGVAFLLFGSDWMQPWHK